MKVTRLTTYWSTEQLILLIDMIDELRDAVVCTYQEELDLYRQEQYLEKRNRHGDNMDLFQDELDL